MILDEILVRTRADLAQRKARTAPEVLSARAAASRKPHGFARALRTGAGIACVAEFKRRSPSAGWISRDADAATVARAYRTAGAAALSVLTDEPFFAGSLADIERVRAVVDLPILRKDFTVDPYQIVEARAAGADAVLLIVAVLSDAELAALSAEARRWGLDALVEAHTEAEIARAVALGADLIGINHRNLDTLAVDTTLAVRMRPLIPAGTTVVAESGIRTAEDVLRMKSGGVDAILVGESLMKSDDPGRALAVLLATP